MPFVMLDRAQIHLQWHIRLQEQLWQRINCLLFYRGTLVSQFLSSHQILQYKDLPWAFLFFLKSCPFQSLLLIYRLKNFPGSLSSQCILCLLWEWSFLHQSLREKLYLEHVQDQLSRCFGIQSICLPEFKLRWMHVNQLWYLSLKIMVL